MELLERYYYKKTDSKSVTWMKAIFAISIGFTVMFSPVIYAVIFDEPAALWAWLFFVMIVGIAE